MKIFISKIALLLFMLLGANVCYANDNISVQTLSITPGESCEIVILFNGESYSGMYSGCQFDLTIPEKLSVATSKKGKLNIVNSSEITSGDVVASSHSFTVSVKGNVCSFRVTSLSAEDFVKKSGVLCKLKVTAADDIPAGNVAVSVSNIWLTASGAHITENVDESTSETVAVGGATVKIASSGYTVVCNEKALDFSSVSDVTAVYAVSKASATSATLKEIESKKVPANTGVIVEGTASATAFVPFAEGSVDAVSPNVLVGVNEAKALAAAEGYILIGGKFLICEAGTLPAHKAYLPASAIAGAKATELVFDFDTVVTGINEVQADSADNSPVYNLNGARVSNLQKGVYVKNGRKFIVK